MSVESRINISKSNAQNKNVVRPGHQKAEVGDTIVWCNYTDQDVMTIQFRGGSPFPFFPPNGIGVTQDHCSLPYRIRNGAGTGSGTLTTYTYTVTLADGSNAEADSDPTIVVP